MTWWLKIILLLALWGLAVDVIFHSSQAKSLSKKRKVFFSVLAAIVICAICSRPIIDDYYNNSLRMGSSQFTELLNNAVGQTASKQSAAQQLNEQYHHLLYAVAINESRWGMPDYADRISSQDFIIHALQRVISSHDVSSWMKQDSLFISTGNNSFVIVFSVPMVTTPKLTIYPPPTLSTTAHLIKETNVGFVIVFDPATTPITDFDYVASAEIAGG